MHFFISCFVFWSGLALPAAEVGGSLEDYQRAERLSARSRGLVVRDRVEPHWLGGTHRFWYRNDLGEGRSEFLLVDASKASRQPAFDHARLAESLARVSSKAVATDKPPFTTIDLDDELHNVRFSAFDQRWVCNLSTYEIKRLGTVESRPEQGPPAATKAATARTRTRREPDREPIIRRSPDRKLEALIQGHNVHLRAVGSTRTEALSLDGTPGDRYLPDLHWSPDSRWLVAFREREGEEHLIHFVESSPRDQLQPRLHDHSYTKPGDVIAQRRPVLFDVVQRRKVAIEESLFANSWSCDRLRWSKDSSRFTFIYNQRGHQVLRLIAVDAKTGFAKTIIEESSPTFIDYSGKFYISHLDETNEILWASERDGWNHLYLFDASTGRLKNQVTHGAWAMRGVDRVDEAKRVVEFHAGGIHPDQDPYHVHHCRVGLDGQGLVHLTEGDGVHELNWSPDRKYYIDRWSRVDLAPVHELREGGDGRLILVLERADDSRWRAAGYRPPERFVSKGRDGKTDIWGIIHRPTDFRVGRRYPVIEDIYAGPHGAFVPKTFRPYHNAQKLAELGFIVVQIDGMGTNHRSKAFHDVCWKNLADSGFPDRKAWLQSAAARYPELDLSRVGIHGTSAGGQSALAALLFHGEFYHAAYSACGCHDNRMDKIWWNEQWMGWPVGPEYTANSNVTNAHKLKGKLMLLVGEMDTNVDPASTMQVVDALIKADKDFDLIVLPGAGHTNGGAYGERRRNDFFVRTFLGVEPRHPR